MRKMLKKTASSRVVLVLVLLLLIAMYGIRIVNLDQDLPAWGVAAYQPKDEGCYAIMAITEWEYGALNPSDPAQTGLEYPLYIQEHVRTNILGNLLEVASFHLFGDNYYGLRMPMVLIGFLNLTMLGLVMLELRRQYGHGTRAELWGILGMLLLMSLHFYFYLSSRTVEPSTLRMLFAQITMLIWLKSRKKGLFCYFCMGACITISVFLVYITNVFLYLAAGLLLLLTWKLDGFKRFFRNACAFVAGTAILFVVAELYYQIVWDTSAIGNTLGAIGVFGGVSGYQISGGGIVSMLRGFLKGAVKYFSAYFFLYAPALLAMVVLLLPAACWQIVKRKDKTVFFVLAVPVSFLLQTMISEDYIWRKLLVIAPYVIYFVYWGALSREKIECLLGGYKQWCNSFENKVKRISAKVIVPVWILCSVGTAFGSVLFHLVLTNDLGKLDFTMGGKLLILVLGCLPILLWGMWAVVGVVFGKKIPMKQTVCLLGCTTLLLNAVFLYLHVWSNPTFQERDSMISLSEEYGLDGKYVIGDFVMGITLYNDIKPVMDYSTNYGSRLIENPDMLMHHYEIDSADMRSYFDSSIFNVLSEYTASQVAAVPGTFQVNGMTRDFALYTAKLRSEVVSEETAKYENNVLRVQEELTELERNSSGLTSEELSERKQDLMMELGSVPLWYADFYGERTGTILSPIYVDTYGDFRGDINAPVYGRIYGDIYGDVEAPIYGDIYGDIYGNVYVALEGQHYGELYGNDYSGSKK